MLVASLVLAVPAAAAGSHQPPSDGGEMPMSFSYSKTGRDAHVRTPVTVTGGAGPHIQRLAYGTTDGVLHLRTLDRGNPVREGQADPEAGIELDEGPVSDTTTFGQGTGSIAPVDTSTEDRVGHLLVLHNDNGAVHLAQVDAASGRVVNSGQAIDQSLGCAANSTPALTGPDGAGDRTVFFTLTAGTCRRAGLMRARFTRAATREAALGPAELIPIADLVPAASPVLVQLEDAAGAVRTHVAVAAGHRLELYSTTAPVEGLQPSIVVPLPADETPLTPVAAAGAPVLYVAAATGSGGTRVHAFAQSGSEQALRLVASSPPLAGAPAPQMAIDEGDGRLVVTTSEGVHVLETSGLAVVGSPAAGPGFSRTWATVSGSYAYLARDNGEPIVIHTDNAERVSMSFFVPNSGHVAGNAFGAPAVSRGFVAWGADPGLFVYRNRDVTPPFVTVGAPEDASVLAGEVTFTAVAGDTRGIRQVDFRLIPGTGKARIVATDQEADEGSPFLPAGGRYAGTVQAGSLANGVYAVDVVVTDAAGNVAVSGRRSVRVAGAGKKAASRRGRCANALLGGRFDDQLTGTRAGDRILGRAGRDALRGLGGADCLSGQAGDDVLDGGGGNDRLTGGPGVNRYAAGRGRDVVNARNGRRERVDCGPGRDRAVVDRRDVVRRCERVRRR
jgi:RTX calcium-binding nonapeptide repeat (4 copies)